METYSLRGQPVGYRELADALLAAYDEYQRTKFIGGAGLPQIWVESKNQPRTMFLHSIKPCKGRDGETLITGQIPGGCTHRFWELAFTPSNNAVITQEITN